MVTIVRTSWDVHREGKRNGSEILDAHAQYLSPGSQSCPVSVTPPLGCAAPLGAECCTQTSYLLSENRLHWCVRNPSDALLSLGKTCMRCVLHLLSRTLLSLELRSLVEYSDVLTVVCVCVCVCTIMCTYKVEQSESHDCGFMKIYIQ